MYFQLVDNQVPFNPGDINLMSTCTAALPRPPMNDDDDDVTQKKNPHDDAWRRSTRRIISANT